MNKLELAIEELREIEAIANSITKEQEVLKKKIAKLKSLLNEEKFVRLPK